MLCAEDLAIKCHRRWPCIQMFQNKCTPATHFLWEHCEEIIPGANKAIKRYPPPFSIPNLYPSLALTLSLSPGIGQHTRHAPIVNFAAFSWISVLPKHKKPFTTRMHCKQFVHLSVLCVSITNTIRWGCSAKPKQPYCSSTVWLIGRSITIALRNLSTNLTHAVMRISSQWYNQTHS